MPPRSNHTCPPEQPRMPPWATTHAPWSNHACPPSNHTCLPREQPYSLPGATTHTPREQPHMPPLEQPHTPLGSDHTCPPGATMHAPPEQPRMPPPPRSNHACPPSNHARHPPRGQNVDTRFWKYYLAPTSLRAVNIRCKGAKRLNIGDRLNFVISQSKSKSDIWWLVRVTMVVAFGFLPQTFGRW